MPLAKVRGVNINYKILGDRGPWVALSPGGRRDISGIETQAKELAALGNRVIEAELKAAAQEVKNGKPLSAPLSQSPHFPPIVSQMLLVGEETGQIDTVLVKIADFYEEEVAVLIDGLSAIIEPIIIVVLGAGVGLIAASVMGPIANLSKNIGNT